MVSRASVSPRSAIWRRLIEQWRARASEFRQFEQKALDGKDRAWANACRYSGDTLLRCVDEAETALRAYAEAPENLAAQSTDAPDPSMSGDTRLVPNGQDSGQYHSGSNQPETPGGVDVPMAMFAAGRAEAPATDKAWKALEKINEIRNSIVGFQSINWSEHIYPLVAALDEAGMQGMPYPEAREYFGTMLERMKAAELRAEAPATDKELPPHPAPWLIHQLRDELRQRYQGGLENHPSYAPQKQALEALIARSSLGAEALAPSPDTDPR